MKYGIWITTLREDDGEVISGRWFWTESHFPHLFDTAEEAHAYIANDMPTLTLPSGKPWQAFVPQGMEVREYTG